MEAKIIGARATFDSGNRREMTGMTAAQAWRQYRGWRNMPGCVHAELIREGDVK